jgi:hypothetical protein
MGVPISHICQCRFCIRRNENVVPGCHHILFLETLNSILLCQFRCPGPLQRRRASSSRSGRTQFHPEVGDSDTCLVIVSVWIFLQKWQLSCFFLHGFPCSSTAPISSSAFKVRCSLYTVEGFVVEQRDLFQWAT